MKETVETRITHIIEQEGVCGSVTIPDDAFAIIAVFAALEADGVFCVDGNITADKVPKLSYNNIAGVRVDVREGRVKVFLSVKLKYGYSIPAATESIREKVRGAIESMTGFTVKKVHVKISDIVVE